ncbi:MAG TPA: hypothetical protein VGX76_20305, partial [Pirellulales bacterium]|nr:hypothetical protein [Pirellulales bacterium]
MTDFLNWLLGIKAAPDWVGGSDTQWRLDFLNPPEGLRAVAAVAAGLGAVVGIWYLYRLEGRSLSWLARLVLSGLRLAIVACMAFMLLELVVEFTKSEQVPSHLLVLMDTSESMSLADPYSDASTAREAALRLDLKAADGEPDVTALRKLSRLELSQRVVGELLGELADGRVVTLYGFDTKLTPLAPDAPLEGLTARGASTGIGDAIAGALAAHRGQDLAGILLVTDGRSNSGLDPRDAAAVAGVQKTPIVVLAAATPEPPRNVKLAGINADKEVFIRDPAEIGVLVEAQGLKDATASVTLEQQIDDGSWKEIGREQVLLGEDAVLKTVTFRITPEAVGKFVYRAKVGDVGPELFEDDNADTVSMRVVRQGIRVLMIAGYPAPEVQFMRNALLRDTALEFASWLQNAEQGYEHIGHRPIRRLPANQKELDHFDVVILIDPDMRNLGPAWPELLTQFVGKAGGGLIYVAGEMNSQRLFTPEAGDGALLGTGGAENSWLKILPIVRDPGLYQSAADVRLSSRDTWTLELTPEGNADPIFQFAPEPSRNREILASLPGMFWHFPVTRAKNGATVLARHGDPRMRNQFGRHVLMATQLYGPGRTVFLGFDSTYRWRYLHEEYYDGFWARLIDRVGRSKVLGRDPFKLSIDKSAYRVGDKVTLWAEVLDASDPASMISELRGSVEWGGDSDLPLDFEPVPDEPGKFEASFIAPQAGAYVANVAPAVAADPDDATRKAMVRFAVEPPRAERDNPTL